MPTAIHGTIPLLLPPWWHNQRSPSSNQRRRCPQIVMFLHLLHRPVPPRILLLVHPWFPTARYRTPRQKRRVQSQSIPACSVAGLDPQHIMPAILCDRESLPSGVFVTSATTITLPVTKPPTMPTKDEGNGTLKRTNREEALTGATALSSTLTSRRTQIPQINLIMVQGAPTGAVVAQYTAIVAIDGRGASMISHKTACLLELRNSF